MGRQKLLLPYAGSTVVGHIVDELIKCPLEQIVVVTGADGPAVVRALDGRGVRLVSNPDPEGQMLSSVRCGLAAAPEGCEAVLLALGDQPGIRREVVERLIGAREESGRGIVVPFYEGHRGHPFLFSTRYREEIMRGHDESGMRGFLDAHEGDLLRVDVEDGSVLQDIDYPEDYQKALGL